MGPPTTSLRCWWSPRTFETADAPSRSLGTSCTGSAMSSSGPSLCSAPTRANPSTVRKSWTFSSRGPLGDKKSPHAASSAYRSGTRGRRRSSKRGWSVAPETGMNRASLVTADRGGGGDRAVDRRVRERDGDRPGPSSGLQPGSASRRDDHIAGRTILEHGGGKERNTGGGKGQGTTRGAVPFRARPRVLCALRGRSPVLP